MKSDIARGPRPEPEPEALRSMLRSWRAPAPSAGIEQELRQAFRGLHRQRRASTARRAVWLSLAAALGIAALSRLWLGVQPAPPPEQEGPITIASARPSLPSTGASERTGPSLAGTEAPAPRVPPAPSRQAPRGPARRDVITEPGQAELLAELARSLRGVRQVQAADGVPRAEALPPGAAEATLQGARTGEPPEYRGDWVAVTDEWPPIHRADTEGGR